MILRRDPLGSFLQNCSYEAIVLVAIIKFVKEHIVDFCSIKNIKKLKNLWKFLMLVVELSTMGLSMGIHREW